MLAKILGIIKKATGKRVGSLFREALRKSAERILNRRLASFKHKAILDDEDMSEYFGDVKLADIGLQKVETSFLIARINFIEAVLGDEEIKASTFVDLGDSSGIFLRALDKKGTSVNIAEEPLKNIKAKGIKAIEADINKRLPFDDNSFDHALLFETLEHLPNPIATLQEIYRVCKKSLFVSIPYVSRTNIYRHNYCPDLPIHEHHIFELCDDDFRKIVSHTGFKINKAEVVEVLDNGKNPKELLLFTYWRLRFGKDLFYGCLKKFALYHLVKQ